MSDGRIFRGWDGHIYLSEHDPRVDYWMIGLSTRRVTDVSFRALGATFHDITHRAEPLEDW